MMQKHLVMRKLIALVLTAVILAGLAGSAAAQTSGFPDVTDSALARDIAVLQMLGVINGDENGNFNPAGTLTRAQFCKMAVVAMGKGEQAALYKNRTIFPDVRSGHWARGYINYAVTGETKLIIGNSDGTFKPDSPITGAQAVTILLRMLAYEDADAGMLWPDGYLALAADKRLTDGINLTAPNAPMSRADAARLFANLLGTDKKGGGTFAATLGTTIQNAVIMELGVAAEDGSTGAIRTSAGVYKTVSGIFPAGILGSRGTLLIDASGKLLTVVPDNGNTATVTVAAVSAVGVKGLDGVQYKIPSTTPAYTASEVTTYNDAFIDIAPGMTVNLYYNLEGVIIGVYVNTSKSAAAYVVGTTTSGYLNDLTGGDTGYKIIKNGMPADASELKQYDVLTYDKSAKILYVSDFKLTGCFESSWPNMDNPSKITVIGHEFPVLPSAAQSLSRYKVGQVLTFFFTSDLQIAGAEALASSSETAIGVVQPGNTSTSATVKLINGVTLSGNPQMSDETAQKMTGELVKVSSSAAGKIILENLRFSAASGDLDLKQMTLGSHVVSAAAKVFERIGKGPLTQISLTDLTQATVASSKILYAGADSSGRVNTLILDDVTGDLYEYGILIEAGEIISKTEYYYGDEVEYITYSTLLTLKNRQNPTGTAKMNVYDKFFSNKPGGVFINDENLTAEKVVTLTEATGVHRSAFYTRDEHTYLMIDGVEYPVWDNVQCYNSLTDTWFKSLNEARAFSETLSVYYDKSPAEGGKIRVVIPE
jgi:hypothetical protein